jgi:membrane protease YdiL (CAAX protease family)
VLLEASGLVAIALRNHQGPAWFGFTRTPVNLSIKLILGGVAVITAVEAITAVLGHYIPFFTKSQYNFDSNFGGLALLQFGILAVLIAPPLEEFLFRGIFFRAVWAKTGPIAAAVISSLIFTLFHGLSGATMALFFFGLYLCFMYKRSGSIIPGIVLHAANNLFSIILLSLGAR